MDTIISDFPIFYKYPDLIYLDNAATTQKPKQVIEALEEFYYNYNSNIHRGVYRLSEIATEVYEKARERVAQYIHADPDQIVFVKNATEALNIAIYNLRDRFIHTSYYEHHSMLLPIYRYAKGYKLCENIEDIKADTIAITHASNVTGKIYDVKLVRENNIKATIIVDGAQYVPHYKPDMKKMDVDMYAFSSHKMLGPTGLGVLYIKDPYRYEPLLLGGGIVSNVTDSMYRLLDNIERYEAGTPPIAEAYAFTVALSYLESKLDVLHRLDQEIIRKSTSLFEEYDIRPINTDQDIPIFSFYFKNIHAHDVAEMLDNYNICVRSGYHCAQPLHEYLNIGPTVRASFYIYNNIYQLEKLVKTLKQIVKIFK